MTTPTTYATTEQAIDAAVVACEHNLYHGLVAVDCIVEHLSRVAPSKPAAVVKFEPHPNQAAALTAAARRIIAHFRNYNDARTEYLADIIREELSDIRPRPSEQVTEPKPAAVGDGKLVKVYEIDCVNDTIIRKPDRVMVDSVPTRNVLESWCDELGLEKGMPLHDLAFSVCQRLQIAARNAAAPSPSGPAQAVTAEMIRAASESRARDQEGEFPTLCDLINYSGENKTHTVIRAALTAALAAQPAQKAEGPAQAVTEEIAALLKRADVAIHHLTNCTDDPAEGPYLADSPEKMEARRAHARDTNADWDWSMADIPLRISDDCEFATVHGFEGEPQWNTAEAIVGAGPLIHDLRAALTAALASTPSHPAPGSEGEGT